MDPDKEDDSSGPSSLSSDQASLCVIPDPDDSSEEDGFIYLDKSSLPASLNISEHDRAIIVFHSIEEDYPAHKDILCQYIRPDGWEESPLDNICLFKVGWVTKNDAVFVVPPGLASSDPVGRVVIPECVLPKDSSNLYQFCYMREYTLLGASTPFQFTLRQEKSCYCDINDKSVAEISDGGKFNSSQEVDSMVQHGVVNLGTMEFSSSSNRQDTSQHSLENTFLGSVSLGSVQKSMSLYLSDCDKYEAFTLMECYGENQAVVFTETAEDSTKKVPKMVDISDNSNGLENDKQNEKGEMHHSLSEEILQLKQQVEEVGEEKKWFQEQYNSLLETVKKYAEDLASERMAKESLSAHMADLTNSHKIICTDNTKLGNELDVVKQLFKDESQKWEDEKKAFDRELNELLSDNNNLRKTVEELQQQKKGNSQTESESLSFSNCSKCFNYEKQIDDLNGRISDYEIMRKCLEVELEEEMKLGKERDSYLVQVEQTKVHNLQMANNWLASTPTSADNGNTLLEMEENINSTLEALECALKEMDILRTRKAAINKANRILREDFMQKKAEWEDRMTKQKNEFDAQLNDLQIKFECEKSSKLLLLEELKALKSQLHLAQAENKQQNVSEAMETAKKEIEFLKKQSAELDQECSILRKNSASKDIEDMNRTLLRNLQEAREEYKKLYTEKALTQEKLSRLKQKVKAKKTSRAQKETTLNSPKADFMDAS